MENQPAQPGPEAVAVPDHLINGNFTFQILTFANFCFGFINSTFQTLRSLTFINFCFQFIIYNLRILRFLVFIHLLIKFASFCFGFLSLCLQITMDSLIGQIAYLADRFYDRSPLEVFALLICIALATLGFLATQMQEFRQFSLVVFALLICIALATLGFLATERQNYNLELAQYEQLRLKAAYVHEERLAYIHMQGLGRSRSADN